MECRNPNCDYRGSDGPQMHLRVGRESLSKDIRLNLQGQGGSNGYG